MSSFAALAEWRDRYPSIGYVAPFAFVVLFIAITPYVPAAASPLAAFWLWPLQVLAGVVVCFLCWPEELSVRPGFRFASIGVGLVVFAIWIAPDVLAPGYRGGILFSNGIMGRPHSSLPLEAQRSAWVLAWRMARATVVVPIAEELFWRGWMMRWLIHSNFQSVRLGTYAPLAFWLTAVLFASEHGPYWDVGLVAGIIYNWWLVRTRNVADCILAHAVTNFVLSAYVLKTGNWQYWM